MPSKKTKRPPVCGSCFTLLVLIEEDGVLVKVVCPRCGTRWEKKDGQET